MRRKAYITVMLFYVYIEREMWLMGIKIGEEATSTLDVDIEYFCSYCGTENLCTETLESKVYTPSIMGINLVKGIKTEAAANVLGLFYNLIDSKDPASFSTVNFSCSCRKCKKQEPWARMDYSLLDRVSSFCLGVSAVAGLYFLVRLGSFDSNAWYGLIVCAVAAAMCIGILRYKTVHTKKMVSLIKELPLESIPKISFYSRERHDEFYKRYYL